MVVKIDSGIDEIKFSMSKNEVIKILGKPDRINEDELKGHVIFYYNKLLLKLKFDLDNHSKLKTIEVFNPETELFGKKVIDKSKEKIISVLNDNNIMCSEFVLYDYDEFDTIFISSLYTTFCFRFDKLISIEFSKLQS